MSLASVIERSKREREEWKYTSLAPLAPQNFAPVASGAGSVAAVPGIVAGAGERHQIVFVNGIWREDLSRLGELRNIIAGDAGTGYRLKLEGQTCLVTAPVELVFLSIAGEKPAETNTRLTIELGASTRLTLIEHHAVPEGKAPVASVIDAEISLGPQAKLVHGKVVQGGDACSHLSTARVTAAAGAYYDRFVLLKGGKPVRDEIAVTLAGPLAQCALNGVMLLRGALHADATTHIVHAAPHGTSRQFYKSAVDGKARGVFQGRITVAAGAQKADATQHSKALLLSDQAEMDAKPELKIYADDVKCSHGAAVGDLDAEALFYLRARGLDENAARALLVRGFFDEILDEIRIPELRDFCREQAERWLDERA